VSKHPAEIRAWLTFRVHEQTDALRRMRMRMMMRRMRRNRRRGQI